jgi:hypothetical protein
MLNIHVEKLAWHVNNLDFENKIQNCDILWFFFMQGVSTLKSNFVCFQSNIFKDSLYIWIPVERLLVFISERNLMSLGVYM